MYCTSSGTTHEYRDLGKYDKLMNSIRTHRSMELDPDNSKYVEKR